MAKKLLALVLSVLMLVSVLPMSALAYGDGDVAAIDDTGYDTLAAAFAAAQDGETIKLLKDAVISVNAEYETVVAAGKSITFDLDGNNATGGCIDVFGNLTVKDTAGNGTIIGARHGIYVNAGGALTIQAGTIKTANSVEDKVGIPIVVDNGSLSITGGSVVNDAASNKGSAYAISVINGGTATIDGGVVDNTAGVSAIYVVNGTLYVLNGSITSSKDDTYAVALCNATDNEGNNLNDKPSTAVISDGIIQGHDWGVVVFGTSSLTVNGGTIRTDASEGYAISTNGNLENSNCKVTITDGMVTGTELGVYFPSGGTLTISGGTVSGGTGVYAKAGAVTISDNAVINGTGEAVAYSYKGDGAKPTGDALVIDNCAYPNGYPNPVAVTGGTLSSTYAKAIGSYVKSDDQSATGTIVPADQRVVGFITGGSFNTDVSDYLANGVIMAEVNGEYVVDEPNAGDSATPALVVETKDGSGNLTGWVVSDGTNNVTIARSFPTGIYSHEITTAVIEDLISNLLDNHTIDELGMVTAGSFALIPVVTSTSGSADEGYKYEVEPYMTVSNGSTVLGQVEIPVAAMSKDKDLEIALATDYEAGTRVMVIHDIAPKETFEVEIDASNNANVTTRTLSPFYVYPEYPWVIENDPADKGQITVSQNSGTDYAVLGDTLKIDPEVLETGYHLDTFWINGKAQDKSDDYYYYVVDAADPGLSDGKIDLKALWGKNTYKVTATAGAHGTMTVDKPNADTSETVTLMIKPETDYHLVNIAFTDDSNTTLDIAYTLSSDASTAKFTMPAQNVHAHATFGTDDYSVTATPAPAEGGTVTVDKTTPAVGETVKLTATVNPGYTFEGFTVYNTDSTGTETTTGTDPLVQTFKMPSADIEVTANFKAIDYKVTLPTDGTVTATKSSGLHIGESVTLTVTPPENKNLSSLKATYKLADDTAVDLFEVTDLTKTFEMPAADVTVTATYAAGVAKIGTAVYGTLAEAVTAATGGATITLIDNAVVNGMIQVGKEVTIDLAGHDITAIDGFDNTKVMFKVVNSGDLTFAGTGTIDASKIQGSKKNGVIVYVDKGHLTLTGNVTLTGANTTSVDENSGKGAAVYVSANGSDNVFTMSDNALITGNRTTNGSGGGVYIKAGATFNMSGNAAITNNSAKNGGGLVLDSTGDDATTKSVFTMSGNAYIMNNDATSEAGGVYVKQYTAVTLSDNVKIANNTRNSEDSNLYLKGAQTIKASGLTNGAKIGATIDSTNGLGTVTNSGSGDNYNLFTSDEGYAVRKSTSGEVEFVQQHEITATAEHATAKISVKAVGASDYVESAYAAQNDTVKVEFEAETGYKYAANSATTTPSSLAGWDATNAPTFTFTMGTEAVDVKATFEPISYYVYFNAPDADATTGVMDDPLEIPYNDFTKTLPGNLYTKTGYYFVGWDTVNPAAAAVYADKATITTNLKDTDGARVDLYALFAKNEYAVVFDSDGGSKIDTAYVLYNDAVAEPTAPTKTGYDFGGWQLAGADYVFTTPVTDNITLKAVWTPKWIYIQYETGEGSLPEGAAIVTQKAVFDEANSPVVYSNENDTKYTAPIGGSFRYWEDEAHEVRNPGGQLNALIANSTTGKTVKFTAIWQNTSYTITYYKNLPDGDKSVYVVLKDAYPVGAEPDVLGLDDVKTKAATPGDWDVGATDVFSGWNTEADGSGYSYGAGDKFQPITENVKVYAQWGKTQRTVTFMSEGTTYATKTVSDGAYVTSPDAPTKTNYNFQGWYEDNTTFANKWDFDNDKVEGCDKTLYAYFIGKDVKVTFDANGGYFTGNDTTFVGEWKYGETPVKPTSDPTKDGSGFNGWFDAQTGGNQIVDADLANMVGEKTVYAQWTLGKVTVTFDAKGGSPAPAQQTVDYDTVITRPSDPAKGTEVFQGWFEDDGAFTKAWDFSKGVTASMTLYAYYLTPDVKATFYANGGKFADYSLEKDVEWKAGNAPDISSLEKPTAEGKGFKGWFDADVNGNQVTSLAGMTGSTNKLYAQWDANLVTVSFDVKDGQPTISAQTVAYGQPVSKPANPSADGKSFMGWFKDDTTFAEEWNFSTGVTASMTLYAYFVTPDVKVTVESAHGTVKINGSDAPVVVAYNNPVDIAITPDPGYEVATVLTEAVGGNPVLSGSDNSWAFTMPAADVLVKVTYRALGGYTITTLPAENGTLQSNADTAKTDDPIKVTLTPATGYSIANYTVSYINYEHDVVYLTAYDVTLDASVLKFKMPAGDTTVSATFGANPYKIISQTVEPANAGYVGAYQGNAIVASAKTDEKLTIKANAYPGYLIDTISYTQVLGGSTSSTSSYKGMTEAAWEITMPATDISILVTYTAIDYTVTCDPAAKVKADPAENVHVGADVTVTIDAGNQVFNKIEIVYAVDGDAIPFTTTTEGKAYEFKMPASDVKVYVVFDDAVAYNVNKNVYYTALDTALTYVTDADTIILVGDVEGNFTIDKNLTIDLNGQTVTGTTDSAAVFDIVENKAFTLTDSVGGGKVCSTGTDATGVNVQKNAKFHMQGGKISDTAIGVDVADEASIYLKGAPVVKDNAVNVKLTGSAMVRFDGALTDGAKIGVTKGVGNFTYGYADASNTEDPSAYFTSDSTEFSVVKNGNEAALTSQFEITLVADGDHGVLKVDGKSTGVYAMQNDTVTVDIVPNDGYAVQAATVTKTGGTTTAEISNESLTDTQYSFKLGSAYPVTVTVQFYAIGYDVTPYSDADGNKIEAPAKTKYNVGDKVDVTITEGTGYHIDRDTLAFVDSKNNEYKITEDTFFYMIADDVTLKATFEKTIYTVYRVESDASLTVVGTATMADLFSFTPSGVPENTYVNIVTVKDGTDDSAVVVPSKTVYKDADNTYDHTEFNMPASNVYVYVTFTELPEVSDVTGMLKQAAEDYSINDDYTGAMIPNGTTVNYYIQNLVNVNDAAKDDFTDYLRALHDAGAELIVYNAEAYTWTAADGWKNADNDKLIDELAIGDEIANGEIDVAINGVPVKFVVTEQQNLLSGAPKLGTKPVAIVEEYTLDPDVIASKFDSTSQYYNNYDLDKSSCIDFTVYLNNVPQKNVTLDALVKLFIPYVGATPQSQLLAGLLHSDNLNIIAADKTKNAANGVEVESNLFSTYAVLKPKTATITAVNIPNIATFEYTTTAPYNNPYTFKVHVKNGYSLTSVMKNGYAIDADAVYNVGDDFEYVYTFIPTEGNYELTAEYAILVSYIRNWSTDDKAAPYILTDDASGTTYTIKPTDFFKSEGIAYSFKEWNTQADGNGTAYDAGKAYAIADVPVGLKLYAIWDATTSYVVVFDDGLNPWQSEFVTFTKHGETTANYIADGYIVVNDVNSGAVITTYMPTLDRTDYVWEGWYVVDPSTHASGIAEYRISHTKSLDDPANKNLIADAADTSDPNVKKVTLYANYTPKYGTGDITVTTDAVDPATFGLYYSDFLEAENVEGTVVTHVSRKFILVDENGNFKNPTPLPDGLKLNEITGEVYGVPTVTGENIKFYVQVVSDDGKVLLSQPKTVTITINELAMTADYAIEATNADAYKTFGDTDPAGYKNTKYLKNITVNGYAVDNEAKPVAANSTTAYVVTSDATTMTLVLKYSPAVIPPHHVSGDPAAAYTFADATYTVPVSITRVAGEDAKTYKIYAVASDVAGITVTPVEAFAADGAAQANYTFTINQKSITAPSVTYKIDPDTYTYTGSAIDPYITVNDTISVDLETGAKKDNNKIELYKTDSDTDTGCKYKIKVTNNVNAGTATVTIKGVGNYKDEFTTTFTIAPKDLADDDVYTVIPDVTYDGNRHKEGNVTATYNGMTLTRGNNAATDDYYVLDADANFGVNTYVIGNDAKENWVMIAGYGRNYTGTRTVYFKIVPDALTATWDLDNGYAFTYDATPKTPKVTQIDASKAKENVGEPTYKYYEIEGDAEYFIGADAAPTNVGNYKVYAALENPNFVMTPDTATRTFSIIPAELKIKAVNASKTYGEADPTLAYTVDPDVAVTITLTREAGEDVKTYAINAYTLEGDTAKNYKVVEFTSAKFTINAKPLTGATITFNPTSDYYTGYDVAPNVEVKLTVAGNEYTLAKDVDYKLVWKNAAGTEGEYVIDVDTYTVTANGIGNYANYKIGGDAFTVLKVAATYTKAPEAIANLQTGSMQNLVTAGTTDDGKIVYSLTESGAYSETIPQGNEAKTFTVYWKVQGDANHEDSQVYGPINVTMTQGSTPTPTPTPSGGGGSVVGGGSVYTVKLMDAMNGTIAFVEPAAYKSEKSAQVIKDYKVILAVKPAANYLIDKVTYECINLSGKVAETGEITTIDADGNYVFPMKAYPTVNITATFKPENDNDPSVGRVTISNYTNGHADCDRGIFCLLNNFDDLNPSEWYHDGIHYCLENGIMQGFGDAFFRPNEYTTRAQVVTTLWNIAGHPIAKSPIYFEDVNYGDWFYDPIMWAAANGIVEGYGDGTFGPNDLITHEQIAKIFYGYAKFYGFDVSAKADISQMSGVEKISNWAYQYIEWAVGAGVCCGVDGNISLIAAPENATRAELATMILNFCTKVATKPANAQQ